MKPLLALTQRVVIDARGERRDALDQRWGNVCASAGFAMAPFPNHPAAAVDLFRRLGPIGLILTGGNDLAALGGDAPERDATELALLDCAASGAVPVLGVCRGAQLLVHASGGTLTRVPRHAGTRHDISYGSQKFDVGSYHDWGIAKLGSGQIATATADDGSIEGFRSVDGRVTGIMWHPERETPARAVDLDLFRIKAT